MFANEAAITVIRIDDVTVQCEVQSTKYNIMINLPKTLFPENVSVGNPFTLFLDKSNSYKKLSIKRRLLSKDDLQKGNQEMLSLLT